MLGRKKGQSGASSGATTLIPVGTELTGDISFCGHLEIEGTVIGNITGTGHRPLPNRCPARLYVHTPIVVKTTA